MTEQPNPETSDATLVAMAIDGDPMGLERLYERHWETATIAARAYLSDYSDIEDAASEGFHQAGSHLAALRNHASFRPYLQRCVGNAALALLHAYRRIDYANEAVPERADLSLFPDGQVVRAEEHRRAWAALCSLSGRQRLVIWMSDVEGLSLSEMAELLGLTPNATSQLAFRAREALRRAFLSPQLAGSEPAECRSCCEHLGAYVRQALGSKATVRLETHLEACAQCCARVDEALELNKSMSQLAA
jgi:RNA polymerase sigma factor (sigma-70 family)